MNIYVGNLNYRVTDDDLKEAFQDYGEIVSAKVIMDKYTDKSKGFGFVEMSTEYDGKVAIRELDGADFMGRNMRVNEARQRK